MKASYLFFLLFFIISSFQCIGQNPNARVVEQNAPPTTLTPEDVQQLIAKIKTLITSNYIDEEAGKRVIKMLDKNLSTGSYADIQTEQDFISRISEDMREESKDLHLYVLKSNAGSAGRRIVRRVAPEEDGQSEELAKPSGGQRRIIRRGGEAQAPAQGRSMQFPRPKAGFFQGKILEGNVGLVKIGTLLPPLSEPMVMEDLTTALEAVKNAEAIIFDLTTTRGGVPETIALLSSHLYGKEKVLLNTYYSRIDGKYELYTMPEKAIFTGNNKVFYILTSSGTASGGEAFAYFNQQHGRANVVGEVTRGAGRLSVPHPISANLSVLIPENNSVHPKSGSGFEKTGVQPDIAIAQDDAFSKAYQLILKEKIAKGDQKASKALAAFQKKEQSIAEELAKKQKIYQDYIGVYDGERKIWLSKKGHLQYQRATAPQLELKKEDDNLFILVLDLPPNAVLGGEIPKLRFERNAANKIIALSLIYKDRVEGPFQKVDGRR